MDTVKIIKKYGQPSGVPVITAYVDEDAPGEAGQERKLYQHYLDLFGCGFTIIDDNPKPYSERYDDLFQFLKGHNFTGNNALETTPKIGTVGDNTVSVLQNVTTHSGKICILYYVYYFNIVDTLINITSTYLEPSYVPVENIKDVVVEL